ncbi:hypothetical protein ACH427_03170 [Streptomyces sp. NPDC020379]|uniref:hypothetical protein n=1 Tax=Streptomyces sp. NPDC020379 TaxID=3365071 RepID=UPI003794DE7D
MADRNLFGGTPADVAENEAGVRVPAAVGTAWTSKEQSATQVTDLVDINGTPITQLVADERGVIPLFWGPANGAESLWIDFGVGRLKLVSNSVGERFKAHLEALDPHNSRLYTDEQLTNYMPRRGAQVASERGRTWLEVRVPDSNDGVADTVGNMVRITTNTKSPAGYDEFTRIKNSGAVVVEPAGPHVPLSVGQYETMPAEGTALLVSRGRAGSEPAVLRVRADGRVEAAGAISAPNIGNARVFSGPTAPSNPRVGDVWVSYGT